MMLSSSRRAAFHQTYPWSSYQPTAVANRPFALRKRHAQRCQPLNSAYTQEAVAAIRSAQQEACRAGGMFVAPPHLLLGLLDQPDSSGSKLLASAGVTSAAAHEQLIDQEAMPLSSSMGAGDLHWAPDARAALAAAAAAAQEADQTAAGTPHLLLGVITCGNAAVNKVLQKAGVEIEAFVSQVKAAVASCSESTAWQPASAENQAAALVQQYQQYVSQHGSAPPAGQAPGLGAGQTSTMIPEDDDIYN